MQTWKVQVINTWSLHVVSIDTISTGSLIVLVKTIHAFVQLSERTMIKQKKGSKLSSSEA